MGRFVKRVGARQGGAGIRGPLLMQDAIRRRRGRNGPDFLIVGAQRAGTTWLHRVLRQHPSLWLAPIKELHYFDKPGVTHTFLDPKERHRLGLHRLLTLDPWLVRFWLGRRNDEWYANLFSAAQRKGLIAGEVTPAYSTLGEDIFRRILRMNEGIKLVFIMRDPLDRAWSAVNNARKKGRLDGAFSVERAIARARSPGANARSAYPETIKTLESVFHASQLHYCFFDDLRERPEDLVNGILTFLGVPTGDIKSYLPGKAVNSATGSKPVPIAFQRELAKAYLPIVAELCHRFDGPPQRWRSRYEAVLENRSDPVPTA